MELEEPMTAPDPGGEGWPVLLVGAAQSGTTLLRLMLDSHPEIAFAEEFEYSVELMGHDGSQPQIGEFHRHLAGNRLFEISGFSIDESLEYRELVDSFLRSRQRQKNAVAVGATMRTGFAKAVHLWPGVKMIHLVRDPRDVAAARVREGRSGNVWYGVERWIEVEDEWDQVTRTLPPEQVMTVRFRDLIDDHDSTLHEICRFIGVDYTAQMLDYAADTDYREPNHSEAGDWRDSMAAGDVRLVETRVGQRLTELGFEPSGLGPLHISPGRRHLLRWHDRVGRVTRRVEFYGFRLTVAEIATRKVGYRPAHRPIERRLTATELANRKKSWSENAKYRTSQ
jgi:hypothetical protein